MVDISYIKETTSTNDLAQNCEVEWSLFLAEKQTAGRGQKGNSWESEPMKNLTFSLILTPTFIHASEQFLISKIVSLSLLYALQDADLEPKIKWPNDIYIGNKKICGILIENNLSSNGNLMKSVIGVGINVNQTIFKSDAPNPTSVAIETGEDINRTELLNDFLLHIYKLYSNAKRGKTQFIDDEYFDNLYRLNTPSAFSDKDGAFQGTIVSVKPQGELVIEKESGIIVEYLFKEVNFEI